MEKLFFISSTILHRTISDLLTSEEFGELLSNTAETLTCRVYLKQISQFADKTYFPSLN